MSVVIKTYTVILCPRCGYPMRLTSYTSDCFNYYCDSCGYSTRMCMEYNVTAEYRVELSDKGLWKAAV
ncbi:MAG: hypothetical protein F7C82_05815 [Desulfurococcales archaeon]|nr:hypothetical protein [Desulfurococcales archaeon]